MIKVLKYALELFWPPKSSGRDSDGLIFTAFDPKRHVIDSDAWASPGVTGAGKSRAFLDELRLMPVDEYLGLHREDRRNLVRRVGHNQALAEMPILLHRYADLLTDWSEANRSSGKNAIGIEQRHTANILRDIADGNPVIFLEEAEHG